MEELMRVKVEATRKKRVKLLSSGRLVKSRSSRGGKSSGGVLKNLVKLALMASLGLGRMATIALVGR
jgi:hypothetical protein